ncbi:MAG: hypothetical protein WKF71_19210 [Pyrinomonadaceae bacterium]
MSRITICRREPFAKCDERREFRMNRRKRLTNRRDFVKLWRKCPNKLPNQSANFCANESRRAIFRQQFIWLRRKAKLYFQDALGFAVVEPGTNRSANLDTIYDLASLTKPLVTGLLCAKLIEARQNQTRQTNLRDFLFSSIADEKARN